MGARIIDGRKIAEKVNEETRRAVAGTKTRGITPGLAVILIGDDPASRSYVGGKDRMCRELGLFSERLELAAETTQAQLIAQIDRLNADDSIHGILVQSPLPAHLDGRAVIERIDPRKDVDGFHPVNVGKLLIGDPTALVPCTPLGCQRLLVESGVETAGAHVVVIGRSLLVGKPLASLLMLKGPGADATVTVVHSRTKNFEEITRSADILVAAIGQPEFVGGNHVRAGVVVLDVGINRVPDSTSERGFRFVGDVKFAEVAERAAAISPVPGGVGPMTIAMLMSNTVAACRRIHGW